MAESQFTSTALGAIRLAQENAARLGHSYVGSEHLLLGFLQQPKCGAAKLLAQAGAEQKKIMGALTRRQGIGSPLPHHRQLTNRLEKIVELKKKHPMAHVLVHPECKKSVQLLADCTGSTAALLDYAVNSDIKEFIVATESGILHQMRKSCPDKLFIPAPPEDSVCACNDCSFMKLNTMEKLYKCLLDESPEVTVDADVAEKAKLPILRMLEMSKK